MRFFSVVSVHRKIDRPCHRASLGTNHPALKRLDWVMYDINAQCTCSNFLFSIKPIKIRYIFIRMTFGSANRQHQPQQHQQQLQQSQLHTRDDMNKVLSNSILYPAALANLPQEVLLNLVQSGHLQIQEQGKSRFDAPYRSDGIRIKFVLKPTVHRNDL